MLRSLVGSEMCIRDSRVDVVTAEQRFRRRRAQPLNGVAVRDAMGQGDDCLLYTSDAADDLLCVDLGGRRIIKKKTVTNQI